MSNTGLVEVWETEDAVLVAWGTHSPGRAYASAAKFYAETNGPNDIPEGILEEFILCITTGQGRYWGSPKLRGIEDETPWPREFISLEPVEGWVPYLVVNW